MKIPRSARTIAAISVAFALAFGGYALATTRSQTVHACANTKTHILSLLRRCPHGSIAVTWNVRGPAGRAGRRGKTGTSVSLNPAVNVTEVSPTTPASASITAGSGGKDTLNLNLPQGQTGATGTAGATSGPNAYGEIWVGSSTAQLAYGTGVDTSALSGGTGSVLVKVDNCTQATPIQPVITVTPNRDANDHLAGANNIAGGEPTAYVDGFSDGNAPGAHVVVFTVTLTSTTTAQPIASDFFFSVSC